MHVTIHSLYTVYWNPRPHISPACAHSLRSSSPICIILQLAPRVKKKNKKCWNYCHGDGGVCEAGMVFTSVWQNSPTMGDSESPSTSLLWSQPQKLAARQEWSFPITHKASPLGYFQGSASTLWNWYWDFRDLGSLQNKTWMCLLVT